MMRRAARPRARGRAAAVSLGLVLALAVDATGAAATDLATRQSEAERQQAALRERISALQKEIDAREAARKEAADALRESESAISRINLRLRELGDAQHRAELELAGLEKQITVQQGVLRQRREELAAQLRAQYTSGLSPWTELLSGGDPQQLGRNLGYLDYISQARARALAALRVEIDRLAQLQANADARRAEIARLAEETGGQKAQLVAQQKERATLVARLEGQISAQRAEAGRLGRDDQRLSRLIDDLEAAIARQAAEAARKAEEARKAAEAARRAEEARKAEAARQARLQAEQARQAAARAAAAEAARVREQAENAARQPSGPVALADPDAAGLRPRLTDPAAGGANSTGPAVSNVQTQSQAPSRAEAGTEEPAAGERPDSRAEREAPRPPAVAGNGLKRGLPVPVRGGVQGRFGVSRPEGGVWRGIVLRAPEGAPVKAVAPGVVVYADWLRGFGNIIIVDHGQQYLTVYAYNQSLLKRVGDPVAAGDTIATVGATGGQVESGLYFEIRHRGAPVDPAQWLAL